MRARGQRRQQHPVHSVLVNDAINDHYESGCGPTDLEAAAAKHRNDQACDDGGEQPLLRRRTRTDGDTHGERKRDNGYGKARDGVFYKALSIIAFPQACNQFGSEERDEMRDGSVHA